jgi:UDP:flavonoid glycosyltransferase YjiC (YdhE family)
VGPTATEFAHPLNTLLKAAFESWIAGVDVPERIRVEEWVPQQAILKHSAVSGYVGHCGTGGTHQTLAFGKPVVCIPFMAGKCNGTLFTCRCFGR